MFFNIHEDESIYNTEKIQKHENKEIKYDHRTKLGDGDMTQDTRKVLAHITNTQYNLVPRHSLVIKNENVFKNEESTKTTIWKDDHANAFGNKEYLKFPLNNDRYRQSPISIAYPTSPQDVSMISIGSSAYSESEESFKKLSIPLYTEPLYRKSIYRYLLESETRHRPHPLYMNKQPELNDNMRCILIDWLVSISDEYEFVSETLYLATLYIDRFLSKMSVVRSKLQLLGVTAMMIAAKYEEIHPPDILEFSSLTKETCTVKQILKMEQLILRVLSFDLTVPTSQTFIDEYVVQSELSEESMNLAMFLNELCLVESVQYLTYMPSEMAASSIALSRHTLGEEEVWPRRLEDLCGYSLTNLYPIMKKQHKVFEESPNKTLQAVRTKYKKDLFKNVSRLTPRKLL